ncbi:hypothetical protein SLE2022_265170 [Rubroshorea leprosula]
MDVLMDNTASCEIYSLMDGNSGYNQVIMVAIFHDFIHIYIEIYIDDTVVKSKPRLGHFDVLRKVFDKCGLYKLKMNPAQCTFGVSVGKLLGFLVKKHGISVDLAKSEAI